MSDSRVVTGNGNGNGLLTHDADGPFAAGVALPYRLPPGRHGIPADIVVEHQRRRLLTAMAQGLALHGYVGVTTTNVSDLAGVSTSTFYKHFGNVWDCLLAAYVTGADRLCEEIEAACAARDSYSEPLRVGIEAALEFFSAEPTRARLLTAQAPLEAGSIAAARRLLVSRLASMLRRGQQVEGEAAQPAGLDERLIDASLAYVANRIAAGESETLVELAPELTRILDRARRAAA